MPGSTTRGGSTYSTWVGRLASTWSPPARRRERRPRSCCGRCGAGTSVPAGLPEGLDLERIAEVGMASAEHRPHAAGQVSGDEQGTPPFVLPDVHAFVRTAALQARGVTCDHDVAE